ncbi:MAG: ferric reductase-like transmembrane domain-containing protein [Patescibacteria group bacterium]
MTDIIEMQRAIKKKQRRTLALFSLGVFFFWLAQFLFQYYWASAGQIVESLVRSFSFAGATLISAALFSSALFRWVPRLAQYWRYRRYLGVSGFVLIFLHVQVAMKLYFNYDLALVYFSLNPLVNPIIFGSIAYVILFLMAITSTDWAMQKLTPKVWKTLHRFVYIAYVSAIFHFLLMAPEDILNNLAGYLLIGLTAAALFGQVFWFFKVVSKKRFRSFGTLVGFVIIVSTLALAYVIWG